MQELRKLCRLTREGNAVRFGGCPECVSHSVNFHFNLHKQCNRRNKIFGFETELLIYFLNPILFEFIFNFLVIV